MTARLLILLLLVVTLYSCKTEVVNDDKVLLNFILKERNYLKKDSVYIQNISDNKRIKKFFRIRNIKEEFHGFSKKNREIIIEKDSSFVQLDTIIYKPIARDDYLNNGKGINKKAEFFLKDTFNYGFSSFKWNFKKTMYNVNPEDTTIIKSNLRVSKPVFNGSKTKAIIYTRETLNYYIEYIYLLEKIDNKWEIVFKQSNNFI